MSTHTQVSMNDGTVLKDVRGVVQKAAAAASEAEKDALGIDLYKAATGRFPGTSAHRLAVYRGAFLLVGIIFFLTVAFTLTVVLTGNSVPPFMSSLALALGSGIIGGLFGYAQQR